ncbi:MAG: hypothetical protein ACOC85_02255 [Thermoplasmatota archaeon]
MNKKGRTGLILTVLAVMIIAVLVTYSFFPPFFKEQTGFYYRYEYAQMYLTDDDYDELVVEIDYMPGFSPSLIALQMFEDKLQSYTSKDSIELKIDEQIPFEESKSSYNKEDIISLADRYQDIKRGRNTMAMYVLYLDGIWSENENVLGLSYSGSNIVMFQERILDISSRGRNADEISDQIEGSVLIHEWGHLLGLVGIDYESEHEVDKHHCNQAEGSCVMAASVEIAVGGEIEPPPTEFCSLCQEDLDKIKTMEPEQNLVDIINYGIIGGEIIAGLVVIVKISVEDSEKRKYYNDYQNVNNHYDYPQDTDEDESEEKYY